MLFAVLASMPCPNDVPMPLYTCYCLPLKTDGIPRATAQTTKGTGFATAQAAVDALLDAAQKYDDKALASILGPNSYDIIHTGEPVRDKEMAIEFATQARAKQSLSSDPKHPDRMILNVGSDDWPFPIPIGPWRRLVRTGYG
jgi:Protein of unknown function (DUF2950)